MPKFNMIVCYTKLGKPDKEEKRKLLLSAFDYASRHVASYVKGVDETAFYNDVKRYLAEKNVQVFLVLGLDADSEDSAKKTAFDLAFHAFGEGNYLVDVIPRFEKLIDDRKEAVGSPAFRCHICGEIITGSYLEHMKKHRTA